MSAAPTLDPTDRRDALATRLLHRRRDVARAPDRLPRGAARAVPGARRWRAGHGTRPRRTRRDRAALRPRMARAAGGGRRPRRRRRGRGPGRAALHAAGRPRRGPARSVEPVVRRRHHPLPGRFRAAAARPARGVPDRPRHRLGALRAGRHRVAGGGQPAAVRAPGRRLDRRPPRHRRAPARRDRAGRRHRLRHGLVVDLDRPALPGRPGRRHRRRRGLDRAGRGERRRRRRRRPGRLPDRGRRSRRWRRPVRPRHDLRGGPRHGPPRRGPRGGPRACCPGGAVLVVDERTADVFTAPGDDMERTLYAYSVVSAACRAGSTTSRPWGRAPMLRPDAFAAMALDAGFSRSTVLPTEHEQFRFYRLDP